MIAECSSILLKFSKKVVDEIWQAGTMRMNFELFAISLALTL
jgi:hypothetical protein